MKYLLVSVPALGNQQNTLHTLCSKLNDCKAQTYPLAIPDFKMGTLDSLVLLSEELHKHDTAFEQATNKIADILATIVKSDSTNGHVREYMLVNDKPIETYLSGFQWNTMKYRTDKSLLDITSFLNQEVTSIDAVMKAKLATYTQNKNALVALERKQTGNLSVKSLNGIIKKEQCILNSEYLQTLFVAVPKTTYKHWLARYETLTPMVVPRSSVKVAEDDEYGLFSVTLFKRVANEFTNKAREEKFIVRDFMYDEDALRAQVREWEEARAIEKEQQSELCRLAQTNLGEVFAAWMHLKVLRVFVETILRYGLPADFVAVAVKLDPKYEQKVDEVLVAQYGSMGGVHGRTSQNERSDQHQDEVLEHDLQAINDENYRPYVQFHFEFDTERT